MMVNLRKRVGQKNRLDQLYSRHHGCKNIKKNTRVLLGVGVDEWSMISCRINQMVQLLVMQEVVMKLPPIELICRIMPITDVVLRDGNWVWSRCSRIPADK